MSAAAGDGTGAHLASLDGLRGLSALCVVAAHVVAALFIDIDAGLVIAFGVLTRAAVIVFFVLSGYVVGGSIRNSLAAGRFSILRFSLHRLTRIYPAFLLAVGLAWAVALLRQNELIRDVPPLIAEPMAISAWTLMRDLAFVFGSGTPLQNANAPVWSLRIEIVCYAVSGLLALAAQAPGAVRAVSLALALALAAAAFARLESALLGFAAFGLGAAGAFALLPHARPLAWGAGLAAAALCAASVSLALALDEPVELLSHPLFKAFQIAVVIAAALSIVRLAGRGRSDDKLGRLAPLAPFSYTLFITHVPLITLTLGLFAQPETMEARIGWCGVLLFWTVAFAAVAARVVERHRELRRWLEERSAVSTLLAWELRR